MRDARRKSQEQLQHEVNKHKESQRTWRSSALMKKTRTQSSGWEGCRRQLEYKKARTRAANRNPRTESIEDWREQEIYWKPSCFSFCIQCNSIPGWTLVSASKKTEGKLKLIGIFFAWSGARSSGKAWGKEADRIAEALTADTGG